jgi:hypothetical protein
MHLVIDSMGGAFFPTFYYPYSFVFKCKSWLAWWFTPVIPGIEIGRIVLGDQPAKKVPEIPSQLILGHSGVLLPS